jgi:molybdopterin synthase catalytic subunit
MFPSREGVEPSKAAVPIWKKQKKKRGNLVVSRYIHAALKNKGHVNLWLNA